MSLHDIVPCPDWALITINCIGVIRAAPHPDRASAVQAYIALIGVPGFVSVALEDPQGNVVSEMTYADLKVR
jgi:hypothetical protein